MSNQDLVEQSVLDLQAKTNKMEVELGALKEKVNFFNVIYGKFDVTLGKIQEMIENRRYESNEELKQVYERVKNTEKRILDEIKEVRTEMKSLHEGTTQRLHEIDRWRWVIVGGGIAGGWFLSKIFGVL